MLVALGGKWRAKKGFVFADDVDAAERIRLAQESGEVLDPRKADFFPTPRDLADKLASSVALFVLARVLEPSAGKGAIADAVRRAEPTASITCVELRPDYQRVLRAARYDVVAGDFLSADLAPASFDCVVMNSPFGGRADIHHVEHALTLLVPGGRLAAVMSAGVQYRQDKLATRFRALVAEHDGDIEPNPDGSFLESGTAVRTVIVTMRRTR